MVTAQLGLLEDDIVYRLALLAVNILQPLKDAYPNIVIKSGFQQVNSGISQHELGEAVDIQINNQTPELLLEVANYIKNNLPFDQLVLNYTNIGDGQPWIHVSFSPNSLRAQVLTKDFADVFHEGLYLVEPLTGEEAAAALREQQEMDAQILAELEKMQSRQAKLAPVSAVPDDQIPSSSVTPATQHARARTVACVKSALALPRSTNATDNIRAAYEISIRVAWLLRDTGCGLLIADSSAPTAITVGAYTYYAGRVCFPDGSVYTILTGILSGALTPTWMAETSVDNDKFLPAFDPGADITQEWLQCAISAPGTPTGAGGELPPSETPLI